MKTNPDAMCTPIVSEGTRINGQDGLTKREYFAAMALAGQAVSSIPGSHNNMTNPSFAKERAEAAVILADALINELNKEVK